MQLIHHISHLRQQITDWKASGLKVAFVPTMGNLHEGHLSLIRLAKTKADKVVVSIFVNPLQFGPNEDFDEYPRTVEVDCEKCQPAGCDMVFAPQVSEIYPSQVQTTVCVSEALTTLWEGAKRPGHFDGVTTVVSKLFNMVQPDVAIFGQKDYQQWCVLQQMVQDMAVPIEMICAPIGRADDGLALSSRNQYLSDEQRNIAPCLQAELQMIQKEMMGFSGNSEDFVAFKSFLEKKTIENLLQAGFDQVDYMCIVNAMNLQPAKSLAEPLIVLTVARLGSTRLLDNLILKVR